MKKRHKKPLTATLFTTALLGIGSLPALADNNPPYTTVNSGLDNFAADVLLQSTDQLSLTVMNYTSGEVGDGFFVGLTQGYINDVTQQQTSDPFYMFCVDFNNEINVPVTYNTIIESIAGALGGPNDPPDPLPGLNESLQTLQTQAVLGSNFGSTPSGNAAADADIQFDIWNLNTPPADLPDSGPPDANMLALLAAAELAQPTANYSGAYLFDITPEAAGNPNGPGQAFMPVDPGGFNNSSSPPAPEPGTLVMLGLGLIGLGSFKLRRSQR